MVRIDTRRVRPVIILSILLAATAAAGDAAGPADAAGSEGVDSAQDAEQPGDIEVGSDLDPAAQNGRVSAIVRIHAPREAVWSVVTSCDMALKTIPGLLACDVLETAPDRSWQLIKHVINYSWYLPKLSYEMRASYEYPSRVIIERVSGDLKLFKGSWYLESDGGLTVAHYSLELSPGFWVPRWLVRAALRRDLPKMLRAVRACAESLKQGAV